MAALNNELRDYLEAMGNDGFQQVPIADVEAMVCAIIASLTGDLTAEDVVNFNKGGLKQLVKEARAKVEASKVEEQKAAAPASAPVPPSGSVELLHGPIFPEIDHDLAAVSERLADSAQRILASTEKVEGLMDGLKPEDASMLLDAITDIYGACGFEDITGQTLDRIRSKMRQIEYESERLLAAMGNDDARKRAEELEKEIEVELDRNKAQLLHGPDSMKEANTQEEIDAILASFD